MPDHNDKAHPPADQARQRGIAEEFPSEVASTEPSHTATSPTTGAGAASTANNTDTASSFEPSTDAQNPGTSAPQGTRTAWEPDELGPRYERRRIELGSDPDGEGEVEANLVRYLGAPENEQQRTNTQRDDRPAVLLVHGMSDYFFQTHVAEALDRAGFAAYGIDLRKCGRSWHEGQRWHYVSDLRLYFDDLHAAVSVLSEEHSTVIPLAHSTGGLIAVAWLDALRTRNDPLLQYLPALALNAPWLDLMAPPAMLAVARPALERVGSKLGDYSFGGVQPSPYGMSLHASHHGEWEYNTTYKPVSGHKKYVRWLQSVDREQRRIHEGLVNVGVPVLTLHSAASHLGEEYSPKAHDHDVILDVAQIRRWAPTLADEVTVVALPGAVHDVFLSAAPVRQRAIEVLLPWLATHIPPSQAPDWREQPHHGDVPAVESPANVATEPASKPSSTHRRPQE